MSYDNLFVTKFPRSLTDSDLLSIFSKYSPKSAKVMLDANTGRSKGFGFVLFENAETGYEAYKSLNKMSIMIKNEIFPLIIYPSNHDGKLVNKANRALYIRNIPISVPQEDLVKFLHYFGTLSSYGARKSNRVWVVYAEYETVQEAENVLKKLHSSTHYFPEGIPLLAKFADTEDAKKARRLRREPPPSFWAETGPPNNPSSWVPNAAQGCVPFQMIHSGSSSPSPTHMYYVGTSPTHRPNNSVGGSYSGGTPGCQSVPYLLQSSPSSNSNCMIAPVAASPIVLSNGMHAPPYMVQPVRYPSPMQEMVMNPNVPRSLEMPYQYDSREISHASAGSRVPWYTQGKVSK